MLDIKKLRESFQEVKDSLSSRGYDIDLGLFQSLDEKRKVLQITVENLQAERKKLSEVEYSKLSKYISFFSKSVIFAGLFDLI